MGWRLRWSILVVLVTTVLVSGLGMAYTTLAQQRADQRWCELLQTLDQPAVPPTTERGRRTQRQIHQLREQLGCGR